MGVVLENVEYLSHFGSVITNDAICTCETTSKIDMAKAAFNKLSILVTSKLELNILHKIGRRKASWMGYILRRNCF
jgi:hypothetical protein